MLLPFFILNYDQNSYSSLLSNHVVVCTIVTFHYVLVKICDLRNLHSEVAYLQKFLYRYFYHPAILGHKNTAKSSPVEIAAFCGVFISLFKLAI